MTTKLRQWAALRLGQRLPRRLARRGRRGRDRATQTARRSQLQEMPSVYRRRQTLNMQWLRHPGILATAAALSTKTKPDSNGGNVHERVSED